MSGKTLVIAIALASAGCSGSGKLNHVPIDDAVVLDEAKCRELIAEYKQVGRNMFLERYRGVPFDVTAYVVTIHDDRSISGKVAGLGCILMMLPEGQDAGVLKPSATYKFRASIWSFDTSNRDLVAFTDVIAVEEVKP